jgi:hypothetical protein
MLSYGMRKSETHYIRQNKIELIDNFFTLGMKPNLEYDFYSRESIIKSERRHEKVLFRIDLHIDP